MRRTYTHDPAAVQIVSADTIDDSKERNTDKGEYNVEIGLRNDALHLGVSRERRRPQEGVRTKLSRYKI